MFSRLSLFTKFLILASIIFAVLAAVFILVSSTFIKDSFINRSKLAISNAVQFEAKDLRAEDFSLKDQSHPTEVFNNFYQRIKTAEIIRIKVWDYSGKVIFSDDASIVGKRFPDNHEFREALKGEAVTEIGQKIKPENVSEQGYEQLLEVYVPITFTGEFIPSGVIEAYYKLDAVNSQIWEAQIILILTIVTFTVAAFGLFFIIFRFIVYKQIEKINLQAVALDNASDHVIITNPDGIIIYVNKAAEKLTGYSQVEMLGKRPSLWGKQMPREFYEKMWKVIKVDKTTFEGQITNKRKTGENYEASTIISPVLNERGQVSFFIGIERDITREKQIDKAKTEFVSLASHQLRTPLSAINWNMELLLSETDDKLSEKQKDYVKQAYKAGRRMNHLIHALLNLSGVELGTFTIERKIVDVVTLCNSILLDFNKEIAERSITVDLAFTPQKITINTDVKLLQDIIENLLSNAVNFTPVNGKIMLSVTARENDILITVQDTGIGIPEKEQKMVFTKLFRASNVEAVDGSGLGIYTIKAIVDNMGGKVWFESQEGKGTAFYVSLPQKEKGPAI